MKNILNKILKHKTEIVVISILLLISAFAHGYNMFHFPYYENDEGVYMSQAWSILTAGELAPYTYWYDHAPAGWIFIALWNFLTGGFFTFGFSINSGRVFMLILHVISSLVLYLITKELTRSKMAAIIAVIIFSLSPLGIYFQRRVLLDNIMVFWMLISLWLLIIKKNQLRYVFLSAVAFGIALLSKETAIFFTPVYLFVLYVQSHARHRIFALVKWFAIVGVVVSFYFFYALMKGEFFPYGTTFGGDSPHVSLLEALKFQSGRSGGSILDFYNSSFWYNMRVWLDEDALLIYAGILATLGNFVLSIKSYSARVAFLTSLCMWIYLMRGGLVIEFYVVPLIPILALNIGVFISHLQSFLIKKLPSVINRFSYIPGVSVLIIFIVGSLYLSTNVRGILNLYTSDQTTVQVKAVDWIVSRGIPDTIYVVDNYGYIDLQERIEDPSIKTEWYWKVDRDPEIRQDLLKDDVSNIDFVALTPQMKNDIAYSGLGLTLAAWKNSQPIVNFSNDRWEVDFWGSTDTSRVLSSSWKSYKNYFIEGGRVMDKSQDNITTSEGQSYAMLRAVWQNDKSSFNEIWSWTKNNLQQESGLFSWKWDGKIIDSGPASDADQDIALALLFASKRWDNKSYLSEAGKIINGIWNEEVAAIDGDPYMLAGNWADFENEIVVNPSYLSPATYRIFAKADKTHPWIRLVETSYDVLEKCTNSNLDKEIGVLPPEWCAINKSTLQAQQPESPRPRASEYSYNAFRTPWRIALDYRWFNEKRAKNYLESLNHLSKEYDSKKKLAVAYTHDGQVWEDYESVAAYGANMGYFVVVDPLIAKEIYQTKIQSKFYEEENVSYWDDQNNYYSQNWAWFGTAMYGNLLPNLWK